MSRAITLLTGVALAVVPVAWTGLHPLATSLAVLGVVGTTWVVRHRGSALRTVVALTLVVQVAATHRLADPPSWWPILAALLLFLFLDSMGSSAEEAERAPGAASPIARRLVVLGVAVVGSAALLESVVIADLGSGLLPTAAAIAAVSALVLGAGQLIRSRP